MVEWCDRILIDYIGSTGFIDNAHEVKLAQFGFREREKLIYEYIGLWTKKEKFANINRELNLKRRDDR